MAPGATRPGSEDKDLIHTLVTITGLDREAYGGG
jgi:hypothetical protein